MKFYTTGLRKVGLAFIPLFCLVSIGQSQNLEIGLFAGKSNYIGEMQFKYYESNHSNTSYGGFVTLNFNKWIGIKSEYLTSQLSGSDANLIDPVLKNRNLSFQTDINEITSKLVISLANFGKIQSSTVSSRGAGS